MITASLKNERITPRKFRLVADMIRGKNIAQAEAILSTVAKKARHPLAVLLDSAVANAKNNFNIEKGILMIKEIRVDQGQVLKRSMPMSKGSAFPIKKRMSHVSLTLAPIEVKADKKVAAAKPVAAVKAVKPTKAVKAAAKEAKK